MRDVQCPSGAILRISAAPFADSRELYKAILKEFKSLSVDKEMDIVKICKDVFCASFSSDEIESALNKCMIRCTYNTGNGDLKIVKDSFEAEKNREDYPFVCVEVMKENIAPFLKNLSAQFEGITSLLGMNPA